MASPGASVPKDCGSAHGLGGCDIGGQAMLGRELADGRESEGSPALSPPLPRYGFPIRLPADRPGGRQRGGAGGRGLRPSYLGKQAEAAEAADDTVNLWQPGPLPTWLGQHEDEDETQTQTQRRRDHFMWLLFLGNQGPSASLLLRGDAGPLPNLCSTRPPGEAAAPRGRAPASAGPSARGARLPPSSRRMLMGLAADAAVW